VEGSAVPTLNGVIEILVKETLTETSVTKQCWNVFHYRLNTGSLDTRSQIAGDFESLVYSFALAQQSADISLYEIDVRLVDDATEQYTAVPMGPTAGGIALPRLPGDLSVVLPFRCVTRGKSFRGRKHMRGVPTASVTKDELTAGATTAWQAVAAKFLMPLVSVTGTYLPIVLSRTLSQLKTNPTTIIGSDVNAVLVNKTIGTFRRTKEKTQR
jgi:hypothetical protein